MHASSLENMLRCYERYIAGPFEQAREVIRVLDMGAADINGSYASIFEGPATRFQTADLSSVDGVDIALLDPDGEVRTELLGVILIRRPDIPSAHDAPGAGLDAVAAAGPARPA